MYEHLRGVAPAPEPEQPPPEPQPDRSLPWQWRHLELVVNTPPALPKTPSHWPAELFDISDPDDEERWQDRALCAQSDPEKWFPEKGGSTHEAKKICLGCEVRAECLDYALDHDERFGIWGGLSERERRRLKRQRDGHASPWASDDDDDDLDDDEHDELGDVG
jgi:WhiB family transcriptional regulator, redox-sensing transcriptional regulator